MNFLNYIKGKRKGKSAQKIELEAMYDPFLNEAIEGYDSVQGNHAKMIAKLQGQIAKKTNKKSPWIALSAVSSVAAIAILFIVFMLGDKNNSAGSQAIYAWQQSASDDVFLVYIPQEYVRQVQMAEIAISPVVEIDNAELLEPLSEIHIFIPEKYIELKKAESSGKLIKTTTTIINLDEILTPDEPLDIYVPEKYLEKRRKRLTDNGIIIRNSTF